MAIEDTTLVQDPSLEQTKEALRHSTSIRSFTLTGLLVLATFYTIYFAQEFFVPLAVAIVFSFVLQPLVRGLKRLRIPNALGSALVILTCLAALGGLAYELSGPVAAWAARVPEISGKLQSQLDRFRKPVEKVSQVSQQVENMATAPGALNQKKPQQVELKKPDPLTGLFSKTYNFLFALLEFIILLYFLLSYGDVFLRKLIHVLPRFEDKRRAVQIARNIEDSVSHYLLTVALINAGLGTAGGLVFWALGVPNPALWGALGFVLNFVPYLGALTLIAILTVVSVATFPNVGHALIVPASYLVLGTIEGNFITPYIVGRRMTLNPVVVFVGLVFWGWMWGIVGALIAVPLLVIFKIICDHVEPLAAIGEFLSD